MEKTAKVTTLSEAAADIFLFVLALRERGELVDFDILHKAALALFEEFEAKARALKAESDAIATARYALAAFVDEAVLNSTWPGKDKWADNPLQLQLFDTFLAGEGFFEKLNVLREQQPARTEVLEIYYFCLLLGFKGRYQIQGTERLEPLLKNIQGELVRSQRSNLKNLSFHRSAVNESVPVEARLPRWLIYTCAAVLSACVLVFVSLFITLRIDAGASLQGLNTAVQNVKALALVSPC